MKKRFLPLLLAVALAIPMAAHAQTSLDPARLSAIQESCTVIQTILDQLQRRDLVSRTNRGREYENTIKQLDALALRLRNNYIAAPQLDEPTKAFKEAVDAFRSAYVQYDDHMNILRKIDCHKNTAQFSVTLEETRILRQQVGAAVTKGEEALAAYRSAVVELQSTLPDATGVQ